MSEINDIDALMALEPPLCEVDLDKVIAYHREQRRRRAAGEKVEKQSVDLSKILNLKPKATTPTFTRRLGG